MAPTEPSRSTPQDDAGRPAQPAPPEKGWVERFAERSAGLPDPSGQPKAKPDAGASAAWKYAGLGIQFAASIAIFAWIGHEIDKWRGWNNWALIALTLVALLGNMYLLIKESMKANK